MFLRLGMLDGLISCVIGLLFGSLRLGLLLGVDYFDLRFFCCVFVVGCC